MVPPPGRARDHICGPERIQRVDSEALKGRQRDSRSRREAESPPFQWVEGRAVAAVGANLSY